MRRRPRTPDGLRPPRPGHGVVAMGAAGPWQPGRAAAVPAPGLPPSPEPRLRPGQATAAAGLAARPGLRDTPMAKSALPRPLSLLRSLRRRLRGGIPGGLPARLPRRLPQGLPARLAAAHAAGAARGSAGRRALEALPRDRHRDDHHQGGKVTGTAGPPPARSRGGRAHQSGPKPGEPSRFTRQVDGDNVRWAREHVAFRVSCSLGRGLGAPCPSGGKLFPFPGDTRGKNLGSITVFELIRNYKNIFY